MTRLTLSFAEVLNLYVSATFLVILAGAGLAGVSVAFVAFVGAWGSVLSDFDFTLLPPCALSSLLAVLGCWAGAGAAATGFVSVTER